MRCGEVMRTHVVTCRETDRADACAQAMRRGGLGFLPVLDLEGRLAGVLTDRDLVVRLLAEGLPPSTPVRELMTCGDLVTCRPEEELGTVEGRMGRRQKSRAVVLDGEDRCVGVISLSQIAQLEEEEVTGRLIKVVTRRETIHLHAPGGWG